MKFNISNTSVLCDDINAVSCNNFHVASSVTKLFLTHEEAAEPVGFKPIVYSGTIGEPFTNCSMNIGKTFSTFLFRTGSTPVFMAKWTFLKKHTKTTVSLLWNICVV